MAQITAEGGKYKAVVLNFPEQVPPGLGVQILGSVFTVGGVHLDAVGADGGGFGDGSASVKPEGFQNDTDGKLVHRGPVLSYIQYFVIHEIPLLILSQIYSIINLIFSQYGKCD